MNDKHFLDFINDKHISVFSEKFYIQRNSLAELLQKITIKNIMIEVGSLAGISTKIFASFFKQVISIDPYLPNYDINDVNSNAQRLSIAKDIFSIRFFDDPTVSQINESSETACKYFDNHSIDFIYLDAGHDYNNISKDIDNWRHKIKPGSFIAGDDYSWDGVKQAVSENFKDYEVINDRWIAKVK